MSELLSELRENWNDGYWWADHELLLATLAATVTAMISLTGAYLEMLLAQKAA